MRLQRCEDTDRLADVYVVVLLIVRVTREAQRAQEQPVLAQRDGRPVRERCWEVDINEGRALKSHISTSRQRRVPRRTHSLGRESTAREKVKFGDKPERRHPRVRPAGRGLKDARPPPRPLPLGESSGREAVKRVRDRRLDARIGEYEVDRHAPRALRQAASIQRASSARGRGRKRT